MSYNVENIRLTYKSKHNFKRENQVILSMITDGKKWHYLAVKKLSVLFRGRTLNHVGDFLCLNCFHSYSIEKKLWKLEKVCNDHDYCYVEMHLWRKVIESSIYYLCWLRMFVGKNALMSK